MKILPGAMTVDVEDYFQVSAFERHVKRECWDQYESRVVGNTHRVLRLFAEHEVRATFFVMGWVAHRFPDLVRDIRRDGHEIGSHSYWHRLIYRQTPDEFRADLRQSRDVLEDILGEPVTAYRAPSFSITPQSLWALDILVEEGFTIDSSIFPIRHDRYGMPDANPRPHRLSLSAGSLWEFPLSVVRYCGLNIPVSGGGYFRLFPLPWTVFCLRKLQKMGQPFVFYFHPWEVDESQPRLPAVSMLSRFRHYVNIDHNQRKLDALLRLIHFCPMGEVVGAAEGSVPEPSLVSS